MDNILIKFKIHIYNITRGETKKTIHLHTHLKKKEKKKREENVIAKSLNKENLKWLQYGAEFPNV